ncbi:hypothetical protein NQF87_08630 [Bombella sp. TMW 2.2559]|uniref:Uncharacterized protein n=1 Tax=Bombella dulcis TaxID=2967339 RepID=A0ABT3WDJ7_9PROT|nr:hypothetical protein [Bombella dulcis]MCX5617026.1 hypothetical protein [Bombella dulcis]
MAETDKKVTVFCRHPSGVVLSLYREEEAEERAASARMGYPNMSAPIPVASITLNGAREDVRFHGQENRILGLAGRTEVPTDFWEAWKKQNATSSLLSGHVIFAETSEQRGISRLQEVGSERTGWEGIPQENFGQGNKVSADIESMRQRRG